MVKHKKVETNFREEKGERGGLRGKRKSPCTTHCSLSSLSFNISVYAKDSLVHRRQRIQSINVTLVRINTKDMRQKPKAPAFFCLFSGKLIIRECLVITFIHMNIFYVCLCLQIRGINSKYLSLTQKTGS